MLIAVPLLAVQIMVSWFYFLDAGNHLDADIRLEQSHHLQALADDLQSEITHAVDELLFLGDQVRLHRALDDSKGRTALGDDFLSFMNTTRLFDQVRLLDGQGMELIRANLNNGIPELVPAAELQDKSRRYYFQHAYNLAKGAIYLSRLDLNIERGEVERPFKPTLRLTTPVGEPNGKRGVLILNYRADIMLSRLHAPDQQGEVILFNSAGYPLRLGNDLKSWRQFLAGDRAYTLARQQPHLWQMMGSSSNGNLRLESGDYYFFTRIDAADYAGLPGGLNSPFHPEEHWYLLIHYPAVAVAGDLAQIWSSIIGFNATGAAIILLLAFVAAYNIRRRRLAFDLVQASERRLRSIYEQTPLGYLGLDADGTVRELNDAAATIFECPPQELEGQDIEKLAGIGLASLRFDEMMRQHEFIIEQADGVERWVELRCKPVVDSEGKMNYHCLLSDISGRKEREHAQLQLARLQATETLSGGIAHLINNYMAIIAGNVDLLAGQIEKSDAVSLRLDRIRKTAFKTSELANGMLNYSRRGSLPFKRCDLAAVLHQSMTPAMQGDARIHVEIDMPLQPVQGDEARLTEVVRILLQNAIEAIDEAGHIRVAACDRFLSSEQDAPFAGLSPGTYVEIQVEDDGCGISTDVQEHLFEPFFSTKFPGRGLSLAAAYGIIKMHGGYLYVQSEEGKGSRFTIFLPAMPADNN